MGGDRHLGTDAGVLEQHPCPDRGVASHEAPVPADLSRVQQRARVQVGEDAEQGGSHLEDLRADDLVGAGGAAPLRSPTPPTASLRAGCTVPEGQRSVWRVKGQCGGVGGEVGWGRSYRRDKHERPMLGDW